MSVANHIQNTNSIAFWHWMVNQSLYGCVMFAILGWKHFIDPSETMIWSHVKVARYHGVDDAVIQLLMTKVKEKLAAKGEEDTWDEAFHASREAQKQEGYCDCCLFVGVLMSAPLSFSFETLPSKHSPVICSTSLLTSERKALVWYQLRVRLGTQSYIYRWPWCAG